MANGAELNNSTLHDVLLAAKKQSAADVHYVVGSPPMMHVNEEFLPLPSASIVSTELANSLVKALLDPEDIAALEQAREIVGVYAFPDGLRMRYHITYQKSVPSLSFHVLSDAIPTIASLRLPDPIAHFATLLRGLVLVVGPYGSGRSSTVAALLQEINSTRQTSIVTIESPIEYLLEASRGIVEQRQVGRDVPTYAAAVSALVESDAEVIMIDALTDPTILPIILELALTRLVFVIIESTGSVHTIEHLLSSVGSRELETIRPALADALAGVISQRVVSRKNGGRIVVAEILRATSPVKAIIRDGKINQLPSIMQTSRADGMVSLDQALAELVRSGEVEGTEALRHAADPEYLRVIIERKK